MNAASDPVTGTIVWLAGTRFVSLLATPDFASPLKRFLGTDAWPRIIRLWDNVPSLAVIRSWLIPRVFGHLRGWRLINLRALGGPEITAFVRRHAPRCGRGWAAQIVTGLQSFFRFAQYRAVIASDLATEVPPVANWAMSDPGAFHLVHFAECKGAEAVVVQIALD